MAKQLKFFGLQQHVAQVAKGGQREQQQGKHHSTGNEAGKSDALAEADGAVEQPEAGQAGGREQWEKQGREHKRGVVMVARSPLPNPAHKCASLFASRF
jgi:hypothetical protein